ncbi:MAG: DUF192 domain-containing protein [Patescibacteria group bacterium]|jgi:hypothetical protein
MGQIKKSLILSFALFSGLLLTGCTAIKTADKADKHVYFGEKKIKVELVTTEADKIKGLSDRRSLCADCGMLFVYNAPSARSFWMKDMNFPLDIIWLKDNQVVGASENLPPAGERPTELYASPGPVNMVLEANAGFVASHGIRAGDEVRIE